MKITGKELHLMVEKVVPDFDDADLYFVEEIDVEPFVENQIKEQKKQGFLSIDNEQGIEVYYTEL